ncbi:Uma2 family endonuclease [Actinocorallia longicatena]|uniref:Uma2 family endonuclease n=1 Tax=Actinocorallia longicatena TaxID=111803 RepID=A0ABP6QCL3_9ACTN
MTKVRIKGLDTLALPETAYSLWASGRLADLLLVPDGYRVEVIEGEIVVSPAARFGHNFIIAAIEQAIRVSGDGQWVATSGTGLDLLGLEAGYIPDAIAMDAELAAEANDADVLHLVPDQVELVVEVTSSSNAANDRQPRSAKHRRTKWSGYARAGVPYYLLVDRDPAVITTTLFSIPDEGTGAYLQAESWKFGEAVHLPEPFGVDIPTDAWKPWSTGPVGT